MGEARGGGATEVRGGFAKWSLLIAATMSDGHDGAPKEILDERGPPI